MPPSPSTPAEGWTACATCHLPYSASGNPDCFCGHEYGPDGEFGGGAPQPIQVISRAPAEQRIEELEDRIGKAAAILDDAINPRLYAIEAARAALRSTEERDG